MGGGPTQSFNNVKNNLGADFLKEMESLIVKGPIEATFSANESIWQYSTTLNYFFEVAVIVIVIIRLVGTSFLCPPGFLR